MRIVDAQSAAATVMAGLAMLAASPALAAPPAGLAGTWRVIGVEVSAVGVQALAHDDPSYLGKRLHLAPARLAWVTPAAPGGTIGDVCRRPQFRRVAIPAVAADDRLAALPGRPVAALAVTCTAGSWGPGGARGATFYRLRDGTLALDWYDGGLLRLKKV